MSKIQSLLLLSALAAIFTHASCTHSQNQPVTFKQRITTIQTEIVDLTSTYEVFSSKLFLEVWDNPAKYSDDALSFLADNKATDEQKTIAVLSMQNLPLSDYLAFCERVLEIRKTNRISQLVFNEAIFPPYGWNDRPYEEYKNPKVREFYIKVREAKLIPKSSTKTYDERYIGHILSGQIKTRIEDLRSAHQITDVKDVIAKSGRTK